MVIKLITEQWQCRCRARLHGTTNTDILQNYDENMVSPYFVDVAASGGGLEGRLSMEHRPQCAICSMGMYSSTPGKGGKMINR